MKMNSKVYKWCAVPLCKNTSIATPKKLFIYVPNKKIMRDKWLKLARRDPSAVVTNSAIYFCEDHFDLPNDMENYMQYHLMGSVSQVRINPGCIPRKFECQLVRKTQTSYTSEQPYLNKKRKTMILDICEKQLEVIKHDYEIAPESSELGKSRAEYMREYRQKKLYENIKNEEAKPKKIARNSTQRSRDFRARTSKSITSQIVTVKLTTVLPNLDDKHAMSSALLPLSSTPSIISIATACSTENQSADVRNEYKMNVANCRALQNSSVHVTSMKDEEENTTSQYTLQDTKQTSRQTACTEDFTNVVKEEPKDISIEYEIRLPEQKESLEPNLDKKQNNWFNVFDNMEQPSIDIKEEILSDES